MEAAWIVPGIQDREPRKDDDNERGNTEKRQHDQVRNDQKPLDENEQVGQTLRIHQIIVNRIVSSTEWRIFVTLKQHVGSDIG